MKIVAMAGQIDCKKLSRRKGQLAPDLLWVSSASGIVAIETRGNGCRWILRTIGTVADRSSPRLEWIWSCQVKVIGSREDEDAGFFWYSTR